MRRWVWPIVAGFTCERAVLSDWRRSFARWIDPPRAKSGQRLYGGSRPSRLTTFQSSSNSSADSELQFSLTKLRSSSRQLMRDAAYAKRARMITVNNVIGSGVGMQCQVKNSRGELHLRINDDIENAWDEWSYGDRCHTGGALCFADFERAAMAEVFTAGEVFIRLHRRAFGSSRIPFAIELIEAERVADEFSQPQPGPANGRSDIRLGIEVDIYGRPLAYWMRERHPGELRLDMQSVTRLERVPAADVIHLRIIDRWPQTRGEPWLHSVIRKLGDMDEYSAAELTAARMSANFFATVESPTNDEALATETNPANDAREMNIEPGVIEQLNAGEQLKFHTPNRPNAALDPFLRYMLREVAAGAGCSYESLSRDYSQSNYSSSRLALLDDRDLWRALQQWWGRSLRAPLYAQWLQQAVLARSVASIPIEAYALDPEHYRAATFKFRGWSWIDPTKEVQAYKDAVRCGFTTVTAVVEQTGGGPDMEDVLRQRRQELDDMAARDLVFDTDPAAVPAKGAAAAPDAAPTADATDATTSSADAAAAPARVLRMRANS
jgi:lambda family phage portal protein